MSTVPLLFFIHTIQWTPGSQRVQEQKQGNHAPDQSKKGRSCKPCNGSLSKPALKVVGSEGGDIFCPQFFGCILAVLCAASIIWCVGSSFFALMLKPVRIRHRQKRKGQWKCYGLNRCFKHWPVAEEPAEIQTLSAQAIGPSVFQRTLVERLCWRTCFD